MEERVRDALRGLIRRFGHSLTEDPARCEALLRDLCGAHKLEINVLIGALRQRVAEELLGASQVPPAMQIERLTRRLEDDLGLAPEPARWAVETWALVLGVSDDPLPAARPETAPTPAGVPDIHGWPAAKVQELQRAAARALGRPVVFQDPLRTPVKVKADGLSGLLGKGKTISQGPEMVVIPAGSFLMGSPEGEEGRTSDQGPQHRVSIARPFALGRHAVTFDDYHAYCAATGRTGEDRPPNDDWWCSRLPVVRVNWDDAMVYCQWLSVQTGQDYRLPSEAEWEYACRAGTATPFHFGDSISTDQANYNGNSTYGHGAKGEYREHKVSVGTLPPNPWGLHEVHGNVWEWCADCWNDDYEGAPTDGSAWQHGNCRRRMQRGGSWGFGPADMRSAFRTAIETDFRGGDFGFRVARTLIPGVVSS